jgi:hypothetical protein
MLNLNAVVFSTSCYIAYTTKFCKRQSSLQALILENPPKKYKTNKTVKTLKNEFHKKAEREFYK